MLVKIPVLILILMVQYTTIEWALPTLALLMVLFSLIFYNMILRVMMTLAESVIDFEDKEGLMNSSLSIFINSVSCIILFYSPYSLVSAFILPWIVLTGINTIWAWLLYLKYFEIVEKDDE